MVVDCGRADMRVRLYGNAETGGHTLLTFCGEERVRLHER